MGAGFILGSIGYAVDMMVSRFIITENEVISVDMFGIPYYELEND